MSLDEYETGRLIFGVWTEGRPISLCGERKKMAEMIKHVTDGRYLHQWQMARDAGFEFLFLIVEDGGRYRIGAGGLMEVKEGDRWDYVKPAIEYKRIDDYMNQVNWYLGVQVKRSSGLKETVKMVVDLYLMFQSPPEEHHSLEQFYVQPEPVASLFRGPSLVRRVSKEVPGIGWGLSKGVERRFGSVYEMVMAGERQWAEVDGIGKGKARVAVEEIRKDCRLKGV